MTDPAPFALPLPPSLPKRLDPVRPLLGLRLLLVEDSRFASEALRLLCQRSGARLRRADSLAAAHRHLAAGLPHVVIVDLGLPDGDGTDLIRQLARGVPRVPALLALSGDPEREAAARDAGAQGFLAKPLRHLAGFQQAILQALPDTMRPQGPVGLPDVRVHPDPLALRDDLMRAQALLSAPGDSAPGYVGQFLRGVARAAEDGPLAEIAARLGRDGERPPGDLVPLLSARLTHLGRAAV